VFAVFGLGSFGFEVCRVLSEKGAKVIAADQDAVMVDRVKNLVTQAILIDSTDEQSLKNAPIEDIDVAIVGIGENIEASMLTTAVLKNLGVPYIISRAISELHAQVLRQIGATEVINIEIEQGNRLASRLVAPTVLEKIYLGKNQVLAEFLVTKNFAGKSIVQLDLRKKANINIISVRRTETTLDELGNPHSEEIIHFPNPSLTLQKNDILVIVGHENDIEKMKDW